MGLIDREFLDTNQTATTALAMLKGKSGHVLPDLACRSQPENGGKEVLEHSGRRHPPASRMFTPIIL